MPGFYRYVLGLATAFLLSLCAGATSVQSIYWSEVAERIQFERFDSAWAVDRLLKAYDALPTPELAAFSYTATKVFWIDSRTRSILVRNLSGYGEPKVLFDPSDGLKAPVGLALDDANGRIYWADRIKHKIQVGHITGLGSPTDLFDASDGVSSPTGVAIDPANGKIYWTNLFADTIQVGAMNGAGTPAVLFDAADGLSSPFGIVLDLNSQKMYWPELFSGKIQSANLNGTGPLKELVDRNDWPPMPTLVLELMIGPLPAAAHWTLISTVIALTTAGGKILYRRRRTAAHPEA